MVIFSHKNHLSKNSSYNIGLMTGDDSLQSSSLKKLHVIIIKTIHFYLLYYAIFYSYYLIKD